MVALLDVQDGCRPRSARMSGVETAPVRRRSGDLGSGTGTMSRQLAGLVAPSTSTGGPMGWVTGVEPNARLRTLAASRAQDHGVPNVSFVDGLAGALPFDDSSIDLVWCERVLQLLDDPHAAIDDIARVLRPGGRAVFRTPTGGADQSSRCRRGVCPRILAVSLSANPYAARRIPAQVQGWTHTGPGRGLVRHFSSEMLLRSQVAQRAADAPSNRGPGSRCRSGGRRRNARRGRAGEAFAGHHRLRLHASWTPTAGDAGPLAIRELSVVEGSGEASADMRAATAARTASSSPGETPLRHESRRHR
jgi:SAM-dependent methyltransferase